MNRIKLEVKECEVPMTTHRMYKRTPQQHAVHQKDSIDTYATLSLDIIPVAREIIDNPMRTKPITA